MKTGVFSNPHNEVSHRVARNLTHQSTRARNARESQEATDATKEVQDELAEELEKRRESSAHSKELKEKLNTLKGKGKTSSGSVPILSASSSGRVKSAPARASKFIHPVNRIYFAHSFVDNSVRKLSTQSHNVPALTAGDVFFSWVN